MALPTSYKVGTVAVAANGTIVTGVGTNWITAGLREGDVFTARGLSVSVASVNSATSLTLAFPWAGSALSGSAYEVRFVGDSTRVLAASREAIATVETIRGEVYANTYVFSTTAEGIANSVAGQQFQVKVGNEMVRYRHSSTHTAIEVGRYASATTVNEAVTQLQTAASGVAADRQAIDLAAQRAEEAAARAIANQVQFVLQTSAALPPRPVTNGPVTWRTWTDPSAAMGPLDDWKPLPTPTIPNVATDWTFGDRLDGQSALLTVPAPPFASPPITDIQYQVDGGTPVVYPGAPVTITGTTNTAKTVRVRYVNFVGPGPWSQAQSVSFRDGFLDDFNRADARLPDGVTWLAVRSGSSSRSVAIRSNVARAEGANETYYVALSAPLPANQYAEARLTAAGTNTSSGRGVYLILRRQAGSENAYFARLIGNLLYLSVNNQTLLDITLPATPAWPALCRFQVVGNVLSFIINGQAVATVTDTANTYGSGQVGFGMNSPSADLALNFLDDFRAGAVR